jgi:hypothetical protein
MAIAALLGISMATFRLADRVVRLPHRRYLLAAPPVSLGCRGAGLM